MHFPFFHPNKTRETSDPPTVVRHEDDLYTNEGAEFLDDAIRTEDLPVATPEDLLKK
jgi:hypothetical protein